MSDLTQKSVAERDRLLIEARAKIREFGFQISTRQLKDVSQIRKIKRDIARLETLRSASRSS